MDGRAFLDVARELIRGTTEAHRRAAAGRIYYALLLEARTLLDRWGIASPSRDKVHSFVRLKLLYSADAGLKEVGLALERLGKIRNDADYQLADPRRLFARPGYIEKEIQQAAMAIDLLDQIDADASRRAAAIESMQPR